MGSKCGSVHPASIGPSVSMLETVHRRLAHMDETQPASLFEQLQQRLAAASEPLKVLEEFEAELLFAFPSEAAAVAELIGSWGYRLSVLERQDLNGYI